MRRVTQGRMSARSQRFSLPNWEGARGWETAIARPSDAVTPEANDLNKKTRLITFTAIVT